MYGKETTTRGRYEYTDEEENALKRLFFSRAKWASADFTVDDDNRKLVRELFLYSIRSDKCQLSFRKGILILGNIGTGKSTLLRAIRLFNIALSCIPQARHLQARGWIMEPAALMAMHYTSTGSIDRYLPRVKDYNNYTHLNLGYRYPPICIDDIGTETIPTQYMGNKINFIEVLLRERYRYFQEHGSLTHGTSNEDKEGLINLYGEVVYDRVKEMFNMTSLTGKSRRK